MNFAQENLVSQQCLQFMTSRQVLLTHAMCCCFDTDLEFRFSGVTLCSSVNFL